MGRVARYKKVKSFDPYSKVNGGRIQLDNVGIWGLGNDGRKPKKRSRTSEKLRAQRKRKPDEAGFDAPPCDKDDFDLDDMIGSLKKQKGEVEEILGKSEEPVRMSAALPVHQNMPEDEEKKVNKLLKVEEKLREKDSKVSKMSRMEGESKAAYRKRVRLETRQIIRKERMSALNGEKRQKKKEFLNRKKSKKKSHAYETAFGNEPSSDGEQSLEPRHAAAVVHFGDQVERPPVFKHLPRGATHKPAKKKGREEGMGDEEVAAERAAMERIRRKVQAQYAAIKHQRKNKGDFHL